MNEEDARRFLLVRAVESADTAELLLTREDRLQATAAAAAQAKAQASGRRTRGRKDDEAFIVRRSEFAFARIATRHPEAARVVARLRWPGWIDWLLPIGALALGIATNELDGGRRLNIIGFPLLGMLAWNLAVFAVLAVRALRRLAPGSKPRQRRNPLAALVSWLAGSGHAARVAGDPMWRAVAQFTADWARYSSALTYSRASRTLHLSAAALAAGVLLGIYLRALSVEYRAGWESTFIDASALRWLLGMVLGPASAISGIALPSVEQLQAIRWSDGGAGENAGRWIHLYAVTTLVFVIAPRLLLAGWQGARSFGLSRRFAVPGTEDFYVRQLLRTAGGGPAAVRVVPYSFHPGEPLRRRLEQILRQVLGEATRISMDTPIDYGGEDDWLAHASFEPDLEHLVVLFNLSATPEAENHGALVAGVLRRLAALKRGVALTVLVEESAFRERLSGQAGAEARLGERLAAWRLVLQREGVTATPVDLAEADAAAAARRIEGALMKTPALVGGARP